MSKHRAEIGKPFDWRVLRRTLYIVVGMGTSWAAGQGWLGSDEAEALSESIAYLVTAGLFGLAAWNS